MKRQKADPQTWPGRRNGAGHFQVGTRANLPGAGSAMQFKRLPFISGIAAILLTVQSAWGISWSVTEAVQTTDTVYKYAGTSQAQLETAPGDLPGFGYGSNLPIESDSANWQIMLGIAAANFDSNSTGLWENNGMTDGRLSITGMHKTLPPDPPHKEDPEYFIGGTSQSDFTVEGASKTSPSGYVRLMVSGWAAHLDSTLSTPGASYHGDRFSADFEFALGINLVLHMLPMPFDADNVQLSAVHPGGGPKVSTGRTAGSTTSSASFFNSGGETLLIVGGGAIDIVSNTPTHTAGTGSYAGDAVEGITLPEVVGGYDGLADGVHTFTPLEGFDQITLTAGDSELIATFEEITIDVATGEGQVHFTETSYIESAGAGDNPSLFLGALIDEHFFDPNDTQTDGLMYNFDATTLLANTNNFTANEFGITISTLLTGAAVVPEPTTLILALVALALLPLSRRR